MIAGHVYDETGDPMAGILVRVLRYQYQQGERRLTPAGTAQTNDLGQYRVWGLMPGDYYVDAQSRINLPFGPCVAVAADEAAPRQERSPASSAPSQAATSRRCLRRTMRARRRTRRHFSQE